MRLTNVTLVGLVSGLLGFFCMTLAPAALAQRGETVSCASNSGKYTQCAVPWREARLVRKESRADCVRDRSWGMNRRGLWVSHGCRAVFAEAGRGYEGHHGGGHAHGGWNREIRLGCSSAKSRYQLCRVDVGHRGSVRLVRQQSKSRCTEGYSWGWNRAGVWVDHGCRADFVVYRR